MLRLVLIAFLLLQFLSISTPAQTFPKWKLESTKLPPSTSFIAQVPNPAQDTSKVYKEKIQALNEIIKAQDNVIETLQFELKKCREEKHDTRP
jgi:hypothetical protein